jgi:hypothetical protein
MMAPDDMKTPIPSASFPELKGFRILLELGRSPKGITYKARRLVEQDVVALKVFRPSLCDRKFVQELPQNAEASFLLEHRNLVRSLGCVHDGGSLLLMTDYAPGDPASKILARERPLPPTRALRIALQCCNALRYAATHKRFHGRLHPGDVILGEDDARIVGIGLGERPEHAAWSSRDAYIFEPLIYTAPEAMPSHATNPIGLPPEAYAVMDIYSLGAILFHMLAGTPPFRGSDEEALIAERKSRLVSPVLWPSEVKGRLPLGAPGLVEKMLSPESLERPMYDEVLQGLTRILENAEKEEAAKQAAAAAAMAATSAGTGFRAGVREAVSEPFPAPPRAPVMIATPHATVNSAAPKPAEPVSSPMLTKMYTMFLVGMTALAFMVVFGFTAIIFFYGPVKRTSAETRPMLAPPQTGPSETSQPILVNQQPNPAPVKKEPSVPISPPLPTLEPKTDEYLTATRQLEYILDMLGKNEIKHTPALLRLAKNIADKAGRDTSTGVKSLVLAAEIEETILKQTKSEAKEPPEPAAGPLIPGVTRIVNPPATEKTETPPAPKTIPVVDVATPPAAVAPEKPAVANAPAQPATVLPSALKLDEKLTADIRAAMDQAKSFEYTDLNSALKKFGDDAQGDARKVAESFAAAAKQECELFKKCRQRLAEQIARHPRHDSPLQVFPRKNDPNGDDITDFDEKGLTISTKKGASVTKTNKAWEKIPPLQAFMLLQLLADRNSADDQCGLAIFAFSRNLKDESAAALDTARGNDGGKEKADTLAELFKIVSVSLEKK